MYEIIKTVHVYPNNSSTVFSDLLKGINYFPLHRKNEQFTQKPQQPELGNKLPEELLITNRHDVLGISQEKPLSQTIIQI